jgi:hypothetical protein
LGWRRYLSSDTSRSACAGTPSASSLGNSFMTYTTKLAVVSAESDMDELQN